MAFKRRRTFKRKFKKRVVPKSVKKYVKKVLDNQIEDKALTSTYTDNTIDNSGPSYQFLTGLGQGVGVTQRVGMRCRLKRLTVRGQVNSQASVNGQIDVRIVIYRRKKNPNSTAENGSLVIDQTDNITVINAPSPVFLYRDSYIVHYDRVHRISGSTTLAGAVPGLMRFNFNRTFKKPILMCYDGTTTAEADQITNQFFIAFQTDSATACTANFLVRPIFEDA